jgi:ribosomal protein S18 acetylase RimI-like enzyme
METQLHRPKRGVTKQSRRSANLAQGTGASGLVLDTGADNERSQQLYRRFGFVRRPERERPRPAPKVQLVVYTLDLAGYQAA